MLNHIFISYARKDQPYTRALADLLRQRGFDVWMDDRIDFGDRWWRTIVQALQESAAFIIVMTPDSHNSEWVEREVLLALEERKPIFPLLLRGRRFPILVNIQYATVTGDRMPPDRFIDRLRHVVPLPETPAPPPPEPEPEQPSEPPPLQPASQQEKPAPQLLEPEVILIPAGHFLMGSDPAEDEYAQQDEKPQHAFYLPDYHIAKTPITNALYSAFLQATDYKPPDHWNRTRPPRGREDHPVVNVSWHDALAYCNWLTDLTAKPYRLPSEAEWEKAARGTDGRIYPWGDEWDLDRCNSRESNANDTTPVGAYPDGASPYGLLDMAGNVWEWTRSLWGENVAEPHFRYPYDPGDGREDLEALDDVGLVVRGGSWDHIQSYARCAFRGRGAPGDWGSLLGVRVVMSLALPPPPPPPSIPPHPFIRSPLR